MREIIITVDNKTIPAVLNDSETANRIWDALPISANANTWGDEIYFSTDVVMHTEADAKAEVEVGELAYWEPGKAFCIFYGLTPVSANGKPTAANPVNVFGEVTGDLEEFKSVSDGASISIEAV